MQTWTYPSSRGVGEYTVTLADFTGSGAHLGCNCRGWKMKRKGEPRCCSHMKDLIEKCAFTIEIRNDHVFVIGGNLTIDPNASIIKDVVTTDTAKLLEPMKAIAMSEGGLFARLLDADGYIIPAKFDAFFASGKYAMGTKLDGHRCQTVKTGDTIFTTLKSIPSLPEHILAALRKMPDGIYDGELIVPGGVSTDVPRLDCRDSLIYAVFDLIECNGIDFTGAPYTQRREALAFALGFAEGQDAVVMVADFDEATWAIVEAIWANGGEGVILKLKTSKYHMGDRSSDWVKVKKLLHFTITVTGFEAGSQPTSVVLGVLDDGTPVRVKNLNNVELAATEANPDAYIGRRLVIFCQQRNRGSKKLRHAMFDHWSGEGE